MPRRPIAARRASLGSALLFATLLQAACSSTDLTIIVRNESDQPAILEITEAPDEVNRRALLIAAPITVEAGAEEAVRFQVPRDRWSLRLRGDLGFFYSDDLGERARNPSFSLVVTPDGVLQIDNGP